MTTLRYQRLNFPWCILLGLCISLHFSGCGGGVDPLPELAEVSGTVTLDGNPLPGAMVTFNPQADEVPGRSSVGTTDDQGRFSLMYNAETPGAMVGEHVVMVNKTAGNPEDAGPEEIPSMYNSESELKANVQKEGTNDFTFDLKSK